MDNYTTQFIEDYNPIGESLLTNQLNGMTEGILNNAQLTELPKHPLIASSKSDHPWIHSACRTLEANPITAPAWLEVQQVAMPLPVATKFRTCELQQAIFDL